MTMPSAPRVGMSVNFHPALTHPQVNGGRAYPALVAVVSDQTPNCEIVELVCFGLDGATFIVSRPSSEVAWIAAGAPPDIDHWAFVDLS
jgi:hypothetical protein